MIFTALFQCCKWVFLGCLMRGRGALKSEEMPLCWLLLGKKKQFWENVLDSLVASLLKRQPKHFDSVFWAIASAMRLSNSSFELAKSESVFKVYLLLVVMQTKQRLLNRHLCSGTHPCYSSAWIKSAVIVQWWWIHCRLIHICPISEHPFWFLRVTHSLAFYTQ